MGKKEKLITSFNPNDFEVVQEPSVKPITKFDPNEFTVVSAPKQPLYKDTFTQVKEVQDAQAEVKKPSPDEVLANVKTNNDSEKELLKNIALKVNEGKASHEELTDAILTIQGQHPKQEGQGSYFVENSGGVYIPRPLKKYELPKQKNVTKIFSDKSTIETFADSWERGKAALAENLVRTPEFLYDLAVNENINKIPNVYNPLVENYNKVAKKEGLKELPVIAKAPTSAELGDITGIHNELADSISREKEKLSRDFQQKYDKGITEYAKNGEYGKAIGLLSNSIIESAPTTIGIALSGGAGATGTAITLAGGAVFGAGKKAELDKEAQGMNETQKLGNAVVTGLAEGFFEQWGITKLGGIVADVFKKEGKDAAKLFAEQAFKKTYAPAIGKYLGITAEEGLGEAATQFAQNVVDKYSGYKPNIKLSDGVADALIVGIGASVAMGAGVAKVESAVEKKIKRANEQSQYLFDTAKKGTEAVNAFKADIDNSVRTGQISKEAADKAKFQLDTYKEYNDQTADLNIPDNQKREIFDKTFQKANLEEHIKGLEPDKMNGIELAKYEGLKKQAKHLQEDINRIVLEAQIKEETIAGEKTIEEHEEEPVIKGKEEKKPILSPELQALKDRYKKPETVKEGKLPEQPKPEEDTRTIAEIPNEVWNHSQFNARTKHAKLADYLETVPDKKTSGVLKENVYTYAKKKNRTYEVELPDGKRIRLASSMLRDTGISGHFRTEHIKGKIAEFPVGVKVEYLPDGKKAIKIFNGKTGKFLSWAKATNTSKKDEWTDLQKDQLEHLSTIVEPPIIPPTEEGEGPIEPVKPTEPTKPITPTNVQQINEKTTTGEKTVPATTSEAVEKGERKAKALRTGTKKANRKIRHPEKIQALNHDVFEPHGIAMQYFIGGGEIGSEAIKAMFKNAKGELNARISYIRKNGPTIDEIAHNLWEQHSELNFDTQDYANAVEDVVLSYNSSTAMAKDLNKQMSEGQDMRFNPLEEVINTEAEIADNNGLGEEFDRAIDFLEGMSDEELIRLANDQEVFNNWYEEHENKIEEGKDIITWDDQEPIFEPKNKYENKQKYKTKKGEEIPYTSLAQESNQGVLDLFGEENKNSGYNSGLKDEVCWMERQMNVGPVSLTGATTIKSSADVAYLFRHLESAPSENAFVVFTKDDGSYNVLYLATGSTSGVIVDAKLVYAAAKDFEATGVYFVHNHPSGNLQPSPQDHSMHKKFRTMFYNTGITVKPSVIINLDSGKYSEFESDEHGVLTRPTETKKEKQVSVHSFDKQILYTPSAEKTKIGNSADVAEFLSKQKRGLAPKLGIIVLDRRNSVNRYVMVDPNLSEDELLDKIQYNVGKSGEAVILSTNDKFDPAYIKKIKDRLSKIDISLLDAIQVNPDPSIIGAYKSFMDEGLINEPRKEYGKNKGEQLQKPKNKTQPSLWEQENAPQLGFDFTEKEEESVPVESAGETKKEEVKEIIATEKSTKKIEDYGEKIGGAKKDLAKSLSEITTNDLISQPLSKSFPRPDYVKLAKEGIVTQEGAIMLKFLYDHIPAKPRGEWKLNRWVKTVESAIDTIKQVIESENTKDLNFTQKIIDSTKNTGWGKEYNMFSQTMKGLGFPEKDFNLGKFQVKEFDLRNFSVYRGKKLTPEDQQKKVYSIVEGSVIVKDFDSIADAIKGLKFLLEGNENKEKKTETKFNVYKDNRTQEIYIGKKGAKAIVKLMGGFKSPTEAFKFLKESHAEIQSIWDGLKINPEERRLGNRERIGVDWRKGKDIGSEEFGKTFGFRGVEFGNWVDSKERQLHVNEAYDALMDMASSLGISPESLSLNGELGFAFGARGGGKASAHYEPDKVVINLTKTKGAGSLAHEWWHSLDNYFSRKRGLKSEYLTEKTYQRMTREGKPDESVRVEMIKAFKDVVDAINSTDLKKRSGNIDATKSKEYWSTVIEMTARSFESFIIDELAKTNQINDYLANFKETSEWIHDTKLNLDNYPYPINTEKEIINSAFKNFFDTIETKKSDKGLDELYQKQKQDKGSVEVGSHEAVLKVTEHIQKVLPKIKVIYNNKLKAAGKLTADGKTIEINPYYAGSDTPIHEAGHVLIDAKGYNHVAIQAGIKQLKKTDLYKETKERYPELSEEMLNKEVLAEAIGREGADIFDSEVEKSKFKQVLEHIFNWLKQRLGLDKNVAKSLAKQIIGGIGTKKLGGQQGEEQKQIIEQKGAQESRESSEKTSEAVKAFDEANSKRGINRNTAMKEFKKNFPNLAPTIKLVTDNFKEIVNQLKQTHNLIEKC